MPSPVAVSRAPAAFAAERQPAKRLPLLLFLLFTAAWIAALLVQRPGWGLMDDAQNLEIAQRIRSSADPAAEYWRVVTLDLKHIGTFRPGYYLWITAAYSLFAVRPLALYVLMALFNMAVLALWGTLAARLFRSPPPLAGAAAFAFPLSFLFFTPLFNVFMYVSLQEKFLLLFAPLSILALERFYRRGRPADFLLALAAFLAGLATKSTMVFLGLAYVLFATADLFSGAANRRRSLFVLGAYAAVSAGFYLFISNHLGGYTARYGQRLKPRLLLGQWLSAPKAVQAVCLLALVALGWLLWRQRGRRAPEQPLALLIPLGALSYVLVILPWGFPNYMLAPLAPFVLLLAFPLWQGLYVSRPLAWRLLNTAAVLLLAMEFAAVAWARAERMGDARRLTEAVRRLAGPQAIFFVPPPYMEIAGALSYFGGARAKYLEEGVLMGRRLHAYPEAYLVFGRDFPPLPLDGVRSAGFIHADSTWQLLVLAPDPGRKGTLRPPPATRPFDRLRRLLR